MDVESKETLDAAISHIQQVLDVEIADLKVWLQTMTFNLLSALSTQLAALDGWTLTFKPITINIPEIRLTKPKGESK